MKSYQGGRNLYGKWTKNSGADNLTLGDEVANDEYKRICGLKDWPFLERKRTITTIASTQNYPLPYDCSQVREISLVISETRYVPKQCPDEKAWDILNQNTYTSDIPEWWFIFNGELLIWPTPASSGNTITVVQKSRVIDLSIADYVTGSITSIANGAKAVVGGSTVWTERMAGRYIRSSLSDTANTGDGVWYEISAVTAATTLSLVRSYGGTSIAAGTASYTIGQMPLLPESFQDLPWIHATADYWATEDDQRALYFKNKYEEKLKDLIVTWSSPTTDMVIDDGEDRDIINPNLVISL